MIVILIGPKGSGKTHIGRLLQSRLGVRFVHVEPIWMEYYDECRRIMRKPLQEEALSRVERVLEDSLLHDSRISFETTAASEHLQAFVAKLSATFDTRRIAVRAPLDVCLHRVGSRYPGHQIPMDEKDIREIHAISSSLEWPYDLVLDNESLTDDQIVERIEKVLATA